MCTVHFILKCRILFRGITRDLVFLLGTAFGVMRMDKNKIVDNQRWKLFATDPGRYFNKDIQSKNGTSPF